jgi:hypothetical protein
MCTFMAPHIAVGRGAADQVGREAARLGVHRRLHSAISDMPPAEFEALYHHQRAADEAGTIPSR